eukprot:gene6698-50812_t
MCTPPAFHTAPPATPAAVDVWDVEARARRPGPCAGTVPALGLMAADTVHIVFALSIVWERARPRAQGNTRRRIAAFIGFGFCDGCVWRVRFGMAARIDPTLILAAAGLTCMIFTCFTLAARYAKRRSYLYLGGFLGSCILGLIACSFLQIFFHWKVLHAMQLYGGLVVFSLYVVYDTQKMIEKAHMGVRDHLIDSLELFIDLMAIFRRVLIILMRSRSDD